MNVLALLQLARVKGLLSAETAGRVLDADPHEIARVCEDFRVRGWLEATPRGWRLTPSGLRFTAGLIASKKPCRGSSITEGVCVSGGLATSSRATSHARSRG
jgi:hypothetical protein